MNKKRNTLLAEDSEPFVSFTALVLIRCCALTALLEVVMGATDTEVDTAGTLFTNAAAVSPAVSPTVSPLSATRPMASTSLTVSVRSIGTNFSAGVVALPSETELSAVMSITFASAAEDVVRATLLATVAAGVATRVGLACVASATLG